MSPPTASLPRYHWSRSDHHPRRSPAREASAGVICRNHGGVEAQLKIGRRCAMKKIAVRKAGSVRLSSVATSIYGGSCWV